MRKIYVLTGKRGGYGAIKQMLKALDENKNINLSLAVTDQHLDKKFGYTVNEIKKDFKVICSKMCEKLTSINSRLKEFEKKDAS